jgi:hydroxyacylglutathione hydrolase
MPPTVVPLTLGSGAFSVNCYLIGVADGFVLVDTGMRNQRAKLEQQLAALGCAPGALKLMIITHGDFDHIGNAAHLRRTYEVPIAMHAGDVSMARDGDMFAGRTSPKAVVRTLLPLLVRLPVGDRFEPDLSLSEDSDLREYGLGGARVLLLHGHSAGSIALLLEDGSLLCGDVLENRTSPKLGSIMDDVPAAEAALARLKTMDVGTVYPGHGRPFRLQELRES